MLLLIDNVDSFTYNLAQYFRELGEEVRVERHDQISTSECLALDPDMIVISPGPGTPAEAGISMELLRQAAGEVPLLGICLGHQCLAEVFGGVVVRASYPMHGKTSLVRHRAAGLFTGLPQPLRVTRYHSLIVDAESLPEELEVTAQTEGGEVMALQHCRLPLWGVQFHPESILTECGHQLLGNFLALARETRRHGRELRLSSVG